MLRFVGIPTILPTAPRPRQVSDALRRRSAAPGAIDDHPRVVCAPFAASGGGHGSSAVGVRRGSGGVEASRVDGGSLLLAISTRSRPERLARYRAESASRSSCSAVVAWSG